MSNRCEQLASVSKRCVGNASGQHAGYLRLAASASHWSNCRLGTRFQLLAAHDEMGVTAHRHLRQMRNDDYLMGTSQLSYDFGQGHGHSSTHPSVDLVEHECFDIVLRTENHFRSQHDAADLTT